MLKLFKLSILTGICMITCSSTFPSEDSDLAKWKLKGKVKQMEKRSYLAKRRAITFDLENLRLEDDFKNETKLLLYFNEEGRNTRHCHYRSGNLKSEFIYSFDSRGNCTQRLWYDYFKERILDKSELYVYNERDQLLQKTIFNLDSILVYKEVTSYNALHQKTKETITHSKRHGGTTTFLYDSKGRVIEEASNYGSMAPTKRVYTYEGTSPHKSGMAVYAADSTIVREESYTYQNGNQLKERIYLADGKKQIDLFNEEGWIADIKVWTLDEGSKPVHHANYEYAYDSKGNWTRKATFKEGILHEVEIRTIEYY